MAGSLIVGNALMWAAERVGKCNRGESENTFADSLLVGCSQILACCSPGFPAPARQSPPR